MIVTSGKHTIAEPNPSSSLLKSTLKTLKFPIKMTMKWQMLMNLKNEEYQTNHKLTHIHYNTCSFQFYSSIIIIALHTKISKIGVTAASIMVREKM